MKERILITAKTYPTLSLSHIELVCTAGVREDGSWVRIYPAPFRFLEKDQQYGKYHWIEIDLSKNPSDPRPESHRPTQIDQIRVLGRVGTEQGWRERRRLVLEKQQIYTNLAEIIQAAKENRYSLVTFKPTQVLDLIVKPAERDWGISRKSAVEAALKQGSLFDESDRSDFRLMPKLPYKFSYRFMDDAGQWSTLMIEDWEIGQLYWNCVRDADETTAVHKVREKYLNDFAATKDLHLFLGTTHEAHVRKFINPYVIVGTFHPPRLMQANLF